tara:strand:+ start:4612 stop:5709 length:1098 start_codon:yes stop_codon:yes gene_type:complete
MSDINVPIKYVPIKLTDKDKKQQILELKKSRRRYKNKKYYTRKKVKSFKSKKSKHITNAERIYKLKKIKPSTELSKATGCSIEGLEKIVKKGQGAYFSSGSRPNQSAHSWGYARLASAITGGKSAAIDYKILEEHCDKNGKAMKLGNLAKKKHGYGTRRVAKIKGGNKSNKKNRVQMKKRGKYHFPDFPDFTPNLSPRDIFNKGSFGGTYWRPIDSTFYKTTLKNQHKKYPRQWWKNIPEEHLTKNMDDYDININKYKVKVGTSLQFWEDKGWIVKEDPYGWVQWYCEFFMGRRGDDDERQISRWKKLAGTKGRFRKWLVTQIMKKGTQKDWNNHSISPAIRQTLQHWGYKLTKKDFDFEIRNRK